jgi:hypothetical protein
MSEATTAAIGSAFNGLAHILLVQKRTHSRRPSSGNVATASQNMA